jgi:hypothetical protein
MADLLSARRLARPMFVGREWLDLRDRQLGIGCRINDMPSAGAASDTSSAQSHGRTIAIVLPVFDDEPSVRKLAIDLQEILPRTGFSTHLIVVDDGSPCRIDTDNLRSLIYFPITILSLRRNVGHQRAIAIGLSYVVGTNLAKNVLIMDSDGEDRPADILKLVSVLDSQEKATVVVAKRANRSEGKLFAGCYRLYRILFRLLTGNEIQFGNFTAMHIDAARRLVAMAELWINFPATIVRSGLPITGVSTDRGQRYLGKSKMNFLSLVLHGFGAIAVFTDRVLTRLILSALTAVALSGAASLIAVGLKLLGRASPGWLTSVIGVSIVVTSMAGGLCLIGLFLTLSGGILFVPAPIDAYQSFVAEVTPPTSERAVGERPS